MRQHPSHCARQGLAEIVNSFCRIPFTMSTDALKNLVLLANYDQALTFRKKCRALYDEADRPR